MPSVILQEGASHFATSHTRRACVLVSSRSHLPPQPQWPVHQPHRPVHRRLSQLRPLGQSCGQGAFGVYQRRPPTAPALLLLPCPLLLSLPLLRSHLLSQWWHQPKKPLHIGARAIPGGGLALETSICSVNYSRMLRLLCLLLLLLLLPPLRLMPLCLLLLRSCPPLGGGQRGLPPLPPFSGRFRSFGLVLALMLLLLLQLVPLSLDSFVTSRRLRTHRFLCHDDS